MIILDTNVFIYLVNGMCARKIIAEQDIAHASITKIEALGFARIHANELILLESLFEESYELALVDPIIERAIKLRQAKNMSIGDAIIAATALEHNYELWTANEQDFAHIKGLQIYNPRTRRK
jgi:predicted nucleic acid-binding protein